MFSSLRTRLVVMFTVALAFTTAGIVGAVYVTANRHNTQVVHDQVESVSRSNSTSLANWVRGKHSVISSLKSVNMAEDPVPLLRAAHTAGDFERTYVGYPDKRFAFSDIKGIPADFDPTTRLWFKMGMSATGPVLTAPFKTAATGELVTSFATPVGPAGAPVAVAGGNISLTRVSNEVRAIKPTERSYGFLVTDDGTIIAHPDEKLTLKPVTDVLAGMTSNKLTALAESKGMPEASIAGRDVYLRVTDIEGADWKLVIAYDKEDAMAGLRSMLKASLLATGVALGLVVVVLALMIARSLRRLGEVRDAMEDVARGEGDLTLRISEKGSDEVAQIASAYNQFANKLATIIKGIRANSESVKMGASEIARGNMDLSSRTEQQASALEETAASMEELTSTVKQSADNARQASQLALASSNSAEKGGGIMARVVDTMSDISASSNKISEITGVIDGIAFQTNILALNAAVEAARAGEAGRGFAVVAAEVRILAQRSAQAAKEIKALIANSNEKVTQGALLVEQAGTAVSEIVNSIKRVTDITSEITVATQEQSVGISQVNETVSQMDTVTQQNAALVEEAAAAASSLEQQADELAAAVGQFKLDDAPTKAF